MKTLHIYSQPFEHADAFIVGQRTALIQLRDTIDFALNNSDLQMATSPHVMTTDGEGYNIHAILYEDHEDLNQLALPYTDESSLERREDAIQPWTIYMSRIHHER